MGKTKTFTFDYNGIPCKLIFSDRDALKEDILGMGIPNPKGVPVAKIKNLKKDWKKPVKFRISAYNGNIPMPTGMAVEGEDFDEDEDENEHPALDD